MTLQRSSGSYYNFSDAPLRGFFRLPISVLILIMVPPSGPVQWIVEWEVGPRGDNPLTHVALKEDMAMRTLDFSPLFRHSVGFDHMQRMLDSATKLDTTNQSYPPYNIEAQGEDKYRITMAVAGFAPHELEVTVNENTLVITGKHAEETEEGEFLHRGIARRAFERRFDLADTIKVTGSYLDNGLLHVTFVREVPEEKKPKQISIQTSPGMSGEAKKLDAKKAA